MAKSPYLLLFALFILSIATGCQPKTRYEDFPPSANRGGPFLKFKNATDYDMKLSWFAYHPKNKEIKKQEKLLAPGDNETFDEPGYHMPNGNGLRVEFYKKDKLVTRNRILLSQSAKSCKIDNVHISLRFLRGQGWKVVAQPKVKD